MDPNDIGLDGIIHDAENLTEELLVKQNEVMELLMKAKQSEINLILSVTRPDRETFKRAKVVEETARSILSENLVEDVSVRRHKQQGRLKQILHRQLLYQQKMRLAIKLQEL